MPFPPFAPSIVTFAIVVAPLVGSTYGEPEHEPYEGTADPVYVKEMYPTPLLPFVAGVGADVPHEHAVVLYQEPPAPPPPL